MKIINDKQLKKWMQEAIKGHPKKKKAIEAEVARLRSGKFTSFNEMKTLFGSLKKVKEQKNTYRLDIGGRKGLRMIMLIYFSHGQLKVLYLGDHKGYDNFKYSKAKN